MTITEKIKTVINCKYGISKIQQGDNNEKIIKIFGDIFYEISNAKGNIYKTLNNKYITNRFRTYCAGKIEMLQEFNDIMIKLLDEYYK